MGVLCISYLFLPFVTIFTEVVLFPSAFLLIRSTRHGRSEEPGVYTTRQAKKAKKLSEKVVKDEGVK